MVLHHYMNFRWWLKQSLLRFIIVILSTGTAAKINMKLKLFCSAVSPSFGISGVNHVDPSRLQQPLCSTAVAIHPTDMTELMK